jgi:hypothetical protein
MGRACNVHGRDETCVQNLGQKTYREETTQET